MAVITTLIITRHGEAHCNVACVAGGDRACTGLTQRGRHQVGLLASRLQAEEPCDVLYATSRRRTQESAGILSVTVRLAVNIESGLSGPHHGEADGQPCLTADDRVAAAAEQSLSALGIPFEPHTPRMPFSTDFGNVSRRVPAAMIGFSRPGPEGWAVHMDEGEEQFLSDEGETLALTMSGALAVAADRLARFTAA